MLHSPSMTNARWLKYENSFITESQNQVRSVNDRSETCPEWDGCDRLKRLRCETDDWSNHRSRHRYTRDPLEVRDNPHLPPIAQLVTHPGCDRAANLEYQPPARPELFLRLRQELLNNFQSCGPGEYRISRLEFANFQLNLILLRLAYVRRI